MDKSEEQARRDDGAHLQSNTTRLARNPHETQQTTNHS